MDFSKFKTDFKNVDSNTIEVFVTTPDFVKFGLRFQARGEPSREQILDIYHNNRAQFFVDAEEINGTRLKAKND